MRDRERRRREGDDERGDQQRLRHRVAAEPGGRAPARDDRAEHEDAVADELNARILLSGCGFTINPYRPMPTSTAPHSAEQISWR